MVELARRSRISDTTKPSVMEVKQLLPLVVKVIKVKEKECLAA